MSHDKSHAGRPGREAMRLSDLDLGRALKKAPYETRLADLQHRLRVVQLAYWRQGRAAVVVFEGWDAAGKGGTIRRLTALLDPRGFEVWPIGAPNRQELRQHYLQRFWTRLPHDCEIGVFDRSWYGRVLVERVEKLTPESDWARAYGEINDFERILTNDGIRVVKLFLHLSLEEQKRRLRARFEEPLKRWKLAPEDFRNLELRDAYLEAIEAMLAETSTPHAPWHLIAAEDKRYGRVAALEAIEAALSAGVDLRLPDLDPEVEALARAHL